MNNKLLKFSKKGCTPCVMVGNYLNEKGINVKEFDVFESQEAIKYGIISVPTLILVNEHNEILDRVVGFNPEEIDNLISQLN